MYRNTYRDDDDAGRTEAYWRRRTITLAAGLGLLALLAWAFSGGGGKSVPASPAQGSTQPSALGPAAAFTGSPTPTGPGQGNGAGGRASAGQGNGAGAGPAVPGLSSAPGSASRAASASPPAQASGSSGSPGAAGPGGRCSPKTLVLSLFTSRPSYGRGQFPEFDVYAVSTEAGRCALPIGPGKLAVVVMSAGRVVWDSADCARGQPNRMAELSRGVPAQESITWNRTVTLPGCVTLASARPGTYQVQARSRGVSSPVRIFRLVRAGLRHVAEHRGQRLADVFHLDDLHQLRRAVFGCRG
jgi:hypothetical protein